MAIKLVCAVDDEQLQKHYEINKDQPVPSIGKLKNSPRKRKDKVLICGGGPSIRQFHPLIQNWKGDIFASKTVEYLHNINVTPTYCIHVDAGDNEPNRVFKNKKTAYLLSTQIKPEVFDTAKGCKVYKFNTISSVNWMPDPVIAGGSNSTIQAFFLCAWLGYKEIHVVGFDCGYQDDPNGNLIKNINRNNIDANPSAQQIIVESSDKKQRYKSTTEYLGMAQEAAKVIQILGREKKIKFHAYGNTTFTMVVNEDVGKGSYTLGEDVPLKWLKAA